MKKLAVKSKKKKKAKPLTVGRVIRAILIAIACLIVAIGLAGRIWHFLTYHLKLFK